MAETWNKKEREKKKRAKKKEKQEKKLEKKENATEVNFEDMLAYIDENGNLSDTPPDPKKMKKVNADDIEIGVPRQADINPEDLIRTGVVTHFNHDKGYGFIKDSQSSDSVFVHINSVKGNITEQSKVTFEVEMGQKGANAVNVVVI